MKETQLIVPDKNGIEVRGHNNLHFFIVIHISAFHYKDSEKSVKT